jgi:hypothetical protein
MNNLTSENEITDGPHHNSQWRYWLEFGEDGSLLLFSGVNGDGFAASRGSPITVEQLISLASLASANKRGLAA